EVVLALRDQETLEVQFGLWRDQRRARLGARELRETRDQILGATSAWLRVGQSFVGRRRAVDVPTTRQSQDKRHDLPSARTWRQTGVAHTRLSIDTRSVRIMPTRQAASRTTPMSNSNSWAEDGLFVNLPSNEILSALGEITVLFSAVEDIIGD